MSGRELSTAVSSKRGTECHYRIFRRISLEQLGVLVIIVVTIKVGLNKTRW
jgi:hypothetical protein